MTEDHSTECYIASAVDEQFQIEFFASDENDYWQEKTTFLLKVYLDGVENGGCYLGLSINGNLCLKATSFGRIIGKRSVAPYTSAKTVFSGILATFFAHTVRGCSH